MSSYATVRDLSAQDSRTGLQGLVQDFDRDPRENKKLMRDLLDNDRQSFYSGAIAYLNLLARYTISYQPVSRDARSLRIRVHTPSGWGETDIPIPPRP